MNTTERAAEKAAGRREQLLETIRVLCQLDGVSGQENAVREELIRRIGGRHPFEVDPSGNLLVFQKGRRPVQDGKKVLLAAHMDEVGFLVTYLTEEGLLKFTTVGGIDSRVYIGKPVRIQTAARPVAGVIGGKAVHQSTKEEQEQPLTADKLYIDISAADRADALSRLAPGDAACFASGFLPFGDGCIKGKALDDRVGCMTLLRILENRYDVNVVCAFTCQAEIGLNGALAARFGVECDAAVVMEGTSANDLGCVEDHQKVCSLKKGVAVSFMDNSALHDRQLFARMLEIGREAGIPCQVKNRVAGGNDAGPIRSSREAVATVVLSVPCRNIHSPSSVAAFEDMDAQYALTDAFLRQAANCPTHRS